MLEGVFGYLGALDNRVGQPIVELNRRPKFKLLRKALFNELKLVVDIFASNNVKELLSSALRPFAILDLLLLAGLINERVSAETVLLALEPVASVDLTVRPRVDSVTLLEVVHVLAFVGATIGPSVPS